MRAGRLRALRGYAREFGKVFIPCVLKSLPDHKQVKAALRAIQANPANLPPSHMLMPALRNAPTALKLAVVVGKRWPSSGAHLTVNFLDNPPTDLRTRILLHMNAWGTRANVSFVETGGATPDVRISREDDGYWSYVGTDILEIPQNEATLNLEGFTMDTPESEFFRVVRHETGHTLGFPHEHMRRTIVNRIDRKKAMAYFMATQGWTAMDVQQQVLTPLEAIRIKGSYRVDETSIMCYRLPGSITKTGRPIVGGKDINEADYKFAASVYPKS